jgi:hypothetical protein
MRRHAQFSAIRADVVQVHHRTQGYRELCVPFSVAVAKDQAIGRVDQYPSIGLR